MFEESKNQGGIAAAAPEPAPSNAPSPQPAAAFEPTSPPPPTTPVPPTTPAGKKPGKKWLIAVAVVLLLAAGAVYVLAFNKGTEQTTKTTIAKADTPIGFDTDQSSVATGTSGRSALKGFQIAIDEINAQGGVLGSKLKPFTLDDKADLPTAKENMQQLINQDKVSAIVGPTNTAIAIDVASILQDSQTPLVIPISTATTITQTYAQRPRNFIFRVTDTDINQVRFLTAWMIQKTNNGRIAIIYDTFPYGAQGQKDVSEVLSRWGKTPVSVQGFTKGATIEQLVPLFKAAQAAKADAIYLYAYPDQIANLLKALDQIKGYTPTMTAPLADTEPVVAKLAGSLAANFVAACSVLPDSNDRTKALYQKIVQKYGAGQPEMFWPAAQAYDAVYLIAAAMKAAGTTTDKLKINDALENLQNVQGSIKLYKQPFSKQNHEALDVKDQTLVYWVGDKLTAYNDPKLNNLEIR